VNLTSPPSPCVSSRSIKVRHRGETFTEVISLNSHHKQIEKAYPEVPAGLVETEVQRRYFMRLVDASNSPINFFLDVSKAFERIRLVASRVGLCPSRWRSLMELHRL